MGHRSSRRMHGDRPVTWNRLTNLDRGELCKLAVWTTEADRRRALSYVDHPLEGTLQAIRALSTGEPAPKNLGLLVAVARYEDAAWMPDGCFEKWRRWERNGSEQLDVAALVRWLDTYESTIASKLRDLETHLMNQCRQQEQELAMVQSDMTLAQQRLHTHREGQILAHLSIGDRNGAVQIAQRVPAGPARDEIDKILRAHSALPNTTTTQGTFPDIRTIVHRLHMSSVPAPDVRAAPMRLVHQDVFDELLAAADMIPAPGLSPQSPPPTTDDLTDEDVRSLDTTASWMCNARGAALTETDQQRVGHKIRRTLDELRRHREDARELAERRQLDALRRDQIDELVARRNADLCNEERAALSGLKQLLESAAYPAHKDGPVLVALVDRLLGAQ